MSFIESLMNLISSLFGGKTEAQPAEQQKQPPFKIKMKDDVFALMTSSESEDMKAKLKSEMEEYERKGIFVYTIHSNRWEYSINNGQFRANPIAPKV